MKARLFKIFFLLIFIFLFLVQDIKAVVDPDSIRQQVEQTVEARSEGREKEMIIDSEELINADPGWSLSRATTRDRDDREGTKVILNWFDGKIIIKKVNGQWYLSLGRK